MYYYLLPTCCTIFVFVIFTGYSFMASHKVHEADLMTNFNWRNVNNAYV